MALCTLLKRLHMCVLVKNDSYLEAFVDFVVTTDSVLQKRHRRLDLGHDLMTHIEKWKNDPNIWHFIQHKQAYHFL